MPPISNLPSLETLPVDASVRTRILASAMEILHAEGFSALTQNAVALRAGVRQSHLTYYFPTRLDLLRNVAQYGCAKMIDPITEGSERGQVTLSQFREFLVPNEMDRGWIRLFTGLMIAAEEDPSIRVWISEFTESVNKRLHVAFCAVVGDVSIETVRMLHACFIGVMHVEMQLGNAKSLLQAQATMKRAVDQVIEQAASANRKRSVHK